jgi:hypothetical protein
MKLRTRLARSPRQLDMSVSCLNRKVRYHPVAPWRGISRSQSVKSLIEEIAVRAIKAGAQNYLVTA